MHLCLHSPSYGPSTAAAASTYLFREHTCHLDGMCHLRWVSPMPGSGDTKQRSFLFLKTQLGCVRAGRKRAHKGRGHGHRANVHLGSSRVLAQSPASSVP